MTVNLPRIRITAIDEKPGIRGHHLYSGPHYRTMAYDNSRRDRPREYFTATCSECGKECEIPFKPTQGRPVYCRDCYRKVQPERRPVRKPRF